MLANISTVSTQGLAQRLQRRGVREREESPSGGGLLLSFCNYRVCNYVPPDGNSDLLGTGTVRHRARELAYLATTRRQAQQRANKEQQLS